MQKTGPPIEQLTRRLGETPVDFLEEPRIGPSGRIHIPAVVHDLLRGLGIAPDTERLAHFQGSTPATDRNRLSIVLLLCWLLHDDWFRSAGLKAQAVWTLLGPEADELAGQVAARKFVTDPDRREELARLTLARCALRPEGESAAQAQDRLASLNSRERARVLAAARAAEERARAIREKLAKKAAEESADKWTRE
ncbi:MAG: hypothetical protein WAU91_01240 [Desulfatitalea sp.]